MPPIQYIESLDYVMDLFLFACSQTNDITPTVVYYKEPLNFLSHIFTTYSQTDVLFPSLMYRISINPGLRFTSQ
jgi:hypothetical protein